MFVFTVKLVYVFVCDTVSLGASGNLDKTNGSGCGSSGQVDFFGFCQTLSWAQPREASAAYNALSTLRSAEEHSLGGVTKVGPTFALLAEAHRR